MTLSRLIAFHLNIKKKSLVGVLFLVGLMAFILSIMMSASAMAQNANERDIELPKPANPDLPSIYLIGDSTVRTGSGTGENSQWGWGSFIAPYFDSTEVNVVNRAIGGRSSRTYISQGYWDQQLKLLKPGDVVFIQFGHNDASPVNDSSRARGVIDGIGNEKETILNKLTKEEETVNTYGAYLRTYISDIRDKGAIPVICSPVPTRGEVIDKLDDYAIWAEQVAASEGTAFLDLQEIIGREYQEAGPGIVQDFFVDDRVHTTREGAQFSAKMVVAALKGLNRNPVVPWVSDKAKPVESRTGSTDEISRPVVKGYGKGVFQVGKLIYQNDFENEQDWQIQMEETEAGAEPRIDYRNGTLDVLMPGRGATIWNRTKFTGPVAITYNVKAPTTYVEKMGIVVRDINSFWHASDPDRPQDIFNDDKYTGAFFSYHTQQGYYASMGGRDNTTTRFRRYPRVDDGEHVDHISLSDRDGLDEYLIQPDKSHTIQLVVFEDVIQYIVDGKVFYEIREGDTITVAKADGSEEKVTYTQERFPPYSEGWFGFRLVNTHHQYSNFRVHRLETVN